MNFKMWIKALQVIPSVSKREWEKLDFVSKWLISTRAAVLIMTFISAALAGLFAYRDGGFHLVSWIVLTAGLILAHATNNLFNDYTDFVRGVDKGNYFRTMYGPQPVADGLMTKRQHLMLSLGTGLVALGMGIYLLATHGWDVNILILLGLGAFFVVFYTWPLKYIAMGEIAVFIVWGPLMIGGGYYTITGNWDWGVVWATIPYALGVTTVIFGKHIDKIKVDKEKKIYTLPVLLGESLSRFIILLMMLASYLVTFVLVWNHYFTPVMLLVLLALPKFFQVLPPLMTMRPEKRPKDFPDGQGGWPLYFAPLSFVNNRSFGGLFMLGLLVDVVLRVLPATKDFWR